MIKIEKRKKIRQVVKDCDFSSKTEIVSNVGTARFCLLFVCQQNKIKDKDYDEI